MRLALRSTPDSQCFSVAQKSHQLACQGAPLRTLAATLSQVKRATCVKAGGGQCRGRAAVSTALPLKQVPAAQFEPACRTNPRRQTQGLLNQSATPRCVSWAAARRLHSSLAVYLGRARHDFCNDRSRRKERHTTAHHVACTGANMPTQPSMGCLPVPAASQVWTYCNLSRESLARRHVWMYSNLSRESSARRHVAIACTCKCICSSRARAPRDVCAIDTAGMHTKSGP